MDRKILSDIREILDRKNIEQTVDNGRDHMNCQITNLETDVAKVIGMMKESEDNTRKCLQNIMNLLKKMHEENQRYHAEVESLKMAINSKS